MSEIEEMLEVAKDCCKADDKKYCKPPCENCLAKALYKAGYRKQKWHKVADGDLPKKEGVYYCYVKLISYGGYVNRKEETNAYRIELFANNRFENDTRYMEIIAWRELPIYEG